MKIVKLLFSIFCFASIAISQPLNNSFENWTGGMPDEWFTTGNPSVNQVSVAYQGSYAAHLEVIDLGGFAFVPVMQSLTSTFVGHPVSEKHGSLQGWYQFTPQGNDALIVSVSMLEGTTNGVGAGTKVISASTSGWTQFTVPIFYIPGSANPNITIISIIISDTAGVGEIGTIGSMGYVDYLTFTGPTSVEQLSGLPENYSLSQNYPNPFNPSTNIEYSIPTESFVELKVYDVLGNEVVTLVNEQQQAGVYRADFTADNFPSGMYFARIAANEFTQVVKMILLK